MPLLYPGKCAYPLGHPLHPDVILRQGEAVWGFPSAMTDQRPRRANLMNTGGHICDSGWQLIMAYKATFCDTKRK